MKKGRHHELGVAQHGNMRHVSKPIVRTDVILCKCGASSGTEDKDRWLDFLKPHLKSCGKPGDSVLDVFHWEDCKSL